MTTAHPGDTVLVTGANGYIAIWVVRKLLENGYNVRGTVRKAEKGEYLKKYFESYVRQGRLEVIVVEDITKEGAFDEAVKGVHAIEHMASPVHVDVDDPEEFIRPAVDGTLGILKSALKNNLAIKRIVITSSCAAVSTVAPEARTFSEADWNEITINEIREQGQQASRTTKYRASKTLAEKGAWKFYEENVKKEGRVTWDVVALNPPMVFGPGIQEISSPSALNASLKSWYDFVYSPSASSAKPKDAFEVSNSWVDVRDLADAHVLALEKEEAGGQRIIVTQGAYIWQEWLDIANALHSSLVEKPSNPLPKGFPEITAQPQSLTYKIRVMPAISQLTNPTAESPCDRWNRLHRDEGSWKTRVLKECFAVYMSNGGGEGQLEFIVVEDFLKENAFDEAVKGVDGVVHLASLVQGGSAAPGAEYGASIDVDELIKPARDGTLNVLKSSTSSPSSNVKRVVYTSSTNAIFQEPLTSPHTVFTEADWGCGPEILKEQGSKASGFVKYMASKTLAERAAWEYYRQSQLKEGNKEEGGAWDLVVLNPPFVLGPNLIPSLPVAAGVQWWFNVVI
ncbi:hypothetical protein EST38_g2831 [Candolleomyces aberdarensis]|uniref:NAD-dependent epimerase/dehydratase domain-containing protein n=1 Tax=Candolleomyces aberdarensis TaxID=2316362 RepID=A0A4Q2DTJ6_9AGAR|nr:hypothetical protein EST38_g2831 [Candolleomyces aberdarensis]